MSSPSQWSLPEQGIRFLTPAFMLEQLHRHPLTRDCYPTAMGFYPHARGHQMCRRRHDDNLLIYCVEGHGRLQTSGQGLSIGPGDLVLLPQGLTHSYSADSEQPWTLYWVHFQGVSSRIFMEYLGYRDNQMVVSVGLAPGLSAAFHSLLAVSRTGYSSSAFINAANHCRHLFTQFVLEANRQRATHASGIDLEAIQTTMRDNIHTSLELGQLAAVAHLSKYHFASRYKVLTGYSPIQHFLHMKMEYACQLLDSSDMPIKAIAAAVGYSDPLYFSRLFRRTVGLSPRAYRSSVRK